MACVNRDLFCPMTGPIDSIELRITSNTAEYLAQLQCCASQITTASSLFKKRCNFWQETHWTNDLKDTILREWGGSILFHNFQYNKRGTAILFSTTFDFQICDHTCDSHGRSIWTLIEHAHRKFNLVNIYAPHTHTERQIYFHNISAFLSSTDENIFAGDFNCIFDEKWDRSGGNSSSRQTATKILYTITKQHNLTAIWRDRNRDIRKFIRCIISVKIMFVLMFWIYTGIKISVVTLMRWHVELKRDITEYILTLAVVTLRTFALGNIGLPREILPEYTRGKCISGFIFPR